MLFPAGIRALQLPLPLCRFHLILALFAVVGDRELLQKRLIIQYRLLIDQLMVKYCKMN
jgi:hypothetical protein